MGLLKHVIFPVLALMYANNVLQFMVLKKGKELLVDDAGWPSPSDPMTPWENKVVGMIIGGALAMLFGSVIGLLTENSHYRAMFGTINLIAFAYDAYDSYNIGLPWKFSAGLAAFVGVGLIAHGMEPGFLTQDKTKTKRN